MFAFFFSNKSWNSLYCAGIFIDVVVSPKVGVT
jgi:hypothetical protein